MVVNCDQREALEDSLSPVEGYGNGAEATTSKSGYVRELRIANAAGVGWGTADVGGELSNTSRRNQRHQCDCEDRKETQTTDGI